ncbi:hypothetical protein CMV_027715, partial [Castanea mollissima]
PASSSSSVAASSPASIFFVSLRLLRRAFSPSSIVASSPSSPRLLRQASSPLSVAASSPASIFSVKPHSFEPYPHPNPFFSGG